MGDLLGRDVIEREAGLASGRLGFHVEVMALVDPVIVGGGLALEKGLGDLGPMGIIDFHDIDRGRSFINQSQAFFKVIGVGVVDVFLEAHAAVGCAFDMVFLLFDRMAARLDATRVIDVHLMASSIALSQSAGVTVLPVLSSVMILLTGEAIWWTWERVFLYSAATISGLAKKA